MTRTDVFQSPGWLSVLADTYGFSPVARLLLDESGAPVGGVPIVELDDMIGRRASTLPFSDFADPIFRSTEDWMRLRRDDDGPWTLRCLRSTPHDLDSDFDVIGRAAWHRIDTTRDPEEIWSSIDPGARRAIRKARKAALVVTEGDGVADLRRFYELHLGVRRHKYGLLAQPYRFFEAIGSRFLDAGAGTLLLARAGGAVAGGVLFVEWGDTLYYKFNASHPDHLSDRPNDLVLWTAIEYAHNRGLSWIDMGVSDLDQPGLVSYKEKYATERGTATTIRSPVGWIPPARMAEGRRLLSKMTDLFVGAGVPDATAQQAGDALYRYFV